MSGLVKSVKKVFKKVAKVVKKIAPYVAMAAAIYFSVGLAMMYFPATAGAAAAMPGVSGLAGVLGLTPAASAALPSFSSTLASVTPQLTAPGAINAALASPAAFTAPITGTAVQTAVGSGVSQGIFGKLATGFSKMAFSDKIAVAAIGSKALGALIAPSAGEVAEDEAIANKRWRGSFYGMDESGMTSGAAPTFRPGENLFPTQSPRRSPLSFPMPQQQQPQPPASLAQKFTAPTIRGSAERLASAPSEFDLFGGFGGSNG